MKTEDSFQDRLQNDFENLGWYCPHLSPPNEHGFPDLLVMAGGRGFFIEVKDFMQIGPKEVFSALFQIAQPPYYLKRLLNVTPVVIAGYYRQTPIFSVLSDRQQILNFFKMGRDDWIEQYGLVYYGPESILKTVYHDPIS